MPLNESDQAALDMLRGKLQGGAIDPRARARRIDAAAGGAPPPMGAASMPMPAASGPAFTGRTTVDPRTQNLDKLEILRRRLQQ